MFKILVVFSGLIAYYACLGYIGGVRINEIPPVKRYGSSMFDYRSDKSLVVFGGRNFDKKFSDFWVFRYIGKYWERMTIPIGDVISNLKLGHRSESLIFISLADERDMFIFGGKDEYGYATDIWCYNYFTRYLEQVLDIKEIWGLVDYTSCILNTNSQNLIFVYGGRTLAKFSTDLWK